jgi:hypothetical protein
MSGFVELAGSASGMKTLRSVSGAAQVVTPATKTMMMSLTSPEPSFAERARVYLPGAENMAVVSMADASPNVTVPPAGTTLTMVHCVVTVPGGFGNPSSVTVPSRFAVFSGSVIV